MPWGQRGVRPRDTYRPDALIDTMLLLPLSLGGGPGGTSTRGDTAGPGLTGNAGNGGGGRDGGGRGPNHGRRRVRRLRRRSRAPHPCGEEDRAAKEANGAGAETGGSRAPRRPVRDRG